MKFNLKKLSYSLSESAESAKIPEYEFAQNKIWENTLKNYLSNGDFQNLSIFLKEMTNNKKFVMFLYSVYEHMAMNLITEYGVEYKDAFIMSIKNSGISLHD